MVDWLVAEAYPIRIWLCYVAAATMAVPPIIIANAVKIARQQNQTNWTALVGLLAKTQRLPIGLYLGALITFLGLLLCAAWSDEPGASLLYRDILATTIVAHSISSCFAQRGYADPRDLRIVISRWSSGEFWQEGEFPPEQFGMTIFLGLFSLVIYGVVSHWLFPD